MHPSNTLSPTDLANQLAPLAQQWPFLPALLLGIGLAASSGLRAFLPLFFLSAAFRMGLLGLQPTGNFAWLASDLALFALGFATVIEILGDKVPLLDHGLDAVGTFIRPMAGALAAGAVVASSDPATGALLGLIVGAPLALGVHATKAGTRGVSTLSTAGVANPLVSFLEDFVVIAMSVAAFFVPALVPLLLLVAAWVMWSSYRKIRHKKPRQRRSRRRAHAR